MANVDIVVNAPKKPVPIKIIVSSLISKPLEIAPNNKPINKEPVSYTHLTLPTILRV